MSTTSDTGSPADGRRGGVEAEFEHFRTSGDVDALGRVFDELSPRLLTMAARRSQNAVDAEDLVQATFLQALQHRDSWDGARPLLPWLAGILSHRAQDLGRRGRVRATVPLLSQEALTDISCDPQQLASLEDDRSAVLTAVEQLGEPYSELLALRIEKGLSNQDLAKALRRPEGTVRVQLARARERLEALLPKELRLAGLLAIDGGALRERLRGELLQASAHGLKAGLSPAAVMAAGSGFLGKCLLVLGVLVFIAGLCVQALMEGQADRARRAVGSVARTGGPMGGAEGEEALALAVIKLDQGDDRVTGAALQDEPDLRIHVVRGGEAERESAPGVGVFLKPLNRRTPGITAVSDEVGIADFFGLVHGSYALSLGPVAVKPTVIQVVGSQMFEVAVPDGVDVTGQVQDFGEAPVPDADVYRIDPLHDDGALWVARTDENGQFTAQDVTAGVEIFARADGHQPSGGRRSRPRVRGAAGDVQPMDLQLGARGHSVEGRVLGTDGQPAPFALILVAVDEEAREEPNGLDPIRPADMQATIASGEVRDTDSFVVRADAGGIFRTDEVARGTVSLFARSWDEPSLVAFATLDVLGQGVARTTLHLERGAEVFGRVMDSEGHPRSGVPLEAEWKGTPLLGGFEHGSGELAMLARATTRRDGTYSLVGLLPGKTGLRHMIGSSNMPKEERVQLQPRERLEWNPVIPVYTEIRVRGVDQAGMPLAGWEVRCERDPSSIRDRGTLILDSDGRARFTGLSVGERVVTLHPPGGTTGREACVPAVHVAVLPSDEEFVLLFDSTKACAINGSIERPEGTPEGEVGCKLQLLHGEFDDCGSFSVPFGDRFEITSLPAGAYRLQVDRERAGLPRGLLLKEFTLEDGQSLDLGELRPERGVTLVLDVVSSSSSMIDVELIRLSRASNGRRLESILGSPFSLRRGATPSDPIRSEPLAHGTYVLTFGDETHGVQSRLVEVRSSAREQREVWELEPGEPVQWRIHFDRQPGTEDVRPRCQPDEGKVDLTLWDDSGNVLWAPRLTRTLDSAGAKVMTISERLLPGTYRLRVEDERFDGWDKPLTVVDFVVAPGNEPQYDVHLSEGR